MTKPVSERAIIFLVGAVQFVNILDFMMVMPLGPDFSEALGIPASHLGIVGAAYTASASLAGVIGMFFLDRFDRRTALLTCLLGLVIGTFAGGLATGLTTLLLSRMFAGFFGGPASAIALSIIADVVPENRRGRAMGAVMGAFSVSSVLGIPIGLELARLGSWRLPFFAVAFFGLAIGAAVLVRMPSLKSHLTHYSATSFREVYRLARSPVVASSALMVILSMVGAFLIIPNISPFLLYNAQYPRAGLGGLYLMGGVVSFFTMRLAGHWIDKFGVFKTLCVVSVGIIANLWVGFGFGKPYAPILLIFIAFMCLQTMRNVGITTILSKVPEPRERARFQSLISAIQHLAAAVGASWGSMLLVELPGPYLEGMGKLTAISTLLTIGVPVVVGRLESRLHRRRNEVLEKELSVVAEM